MSEQTVNNNFDDFMSNINDHHPVQTVRDEDINFASAGNNEFGSSQNQTQPKNQQFLINDFDDFVQPSHSDVAAKGHSHGGDFDEHKYVSSKTADLLGDFLERERGDPPAIPKFDVKAEINVYDDDDFGETPKLSHNSQKLIDNLQQKKKDDFVAIKESSTKEEEEDFRQIQPDYLNPYASTKLESNEKFISTDDLIGLSDNEGKDNAAFEDCNKDDGFTPMSIFVADTIKEPEPVETFVKPVEPVKTEPIVAAAASKPEPPKPASVPAPEPKAVTQEKAKEEPKVESKKKPVEPLEAEKLFKRIGLGESYFVFTR